jgi:hypothetical protein
MKIKTGFYTLAAALLVIALGIWVDAARARWRAEAKLGSLATRRDALAREIRDRTHRLETEAALTADAAPQATKNVASTVAPVAKKALVGRAAAMPDPLTNDPKLQTLELQRLRAGVALDYGEFFRIRGLPPAQIEKFLENKAKRVELDLDLDLAATGQDAAGKRATRTMRQRGEADYQAAQMEALGPENYRALLDYERTLLVRNGIVNGLAGSAALAGLPLTAEQGDRLFQAALAAAGNDPAMSGFELARRIDWQLLDAQAQQILTPEQFTLFRSVAPQNESLSRFSLQTDAAVARARLTEVESRK